MLKRRRYLSGNQWRVLDLVRDAGPRGLRAADYGEKNTLQSLERLGLGIWRAGSRLELTPAGRELLEEDRPHKAGR